MALESLYIIALTFLALTTMLGVPGPLLISIGTFIYGLQTGFSVFSANMVILFISLGILGLILDNIFTLLGAKKLGASKFGVIGAFTGFFTVFILGPIGIIVGPPVCAFLAEMFISKKTGDQALRAAFGAVIGLISGLIAKMLLSIIMVVWFALIIFQVI